MKVFLNKNNNKANLTLREFLSFLINFALRKFAEQFFKILKIVEHFSKQNIGIFENFLECKKLCYSLKSLENSTL